MDVIQRWSIYEKNALRDPLPPIQSEGGCMCGCVYKLSAIIKGLPATSFQLPEKTKALITNSFRIGTTVSL